MNEKHCKDCPCYIVRDELASWDGECHLKPRQYAGDFEDADGDEDAAWAFPPHDKDDWCYTGRQIMEKEEEQQRAKEYWDKKFGGEPQ